MRGGRERGGGDVGVGVGVGGRGGRRERAALGAQGAPWRRRSVGGLPRGEHWASRGIWRLGRRRPRRGGGSRNRPRPRSARARKREKRLSPRGICRRAPAIASGPCFLGPAARGAIGDWAVDGRILRPAARGHCMGGGSGRRASDDWQRPPANMKRRRQRPGGLGLGVFGNYRASARAACSFFLQNCLSAWARGTRP